MYNNESIMHLLLFIYLFQMFLNCIKKIQSFQFVTQSVMRKSCHIWYTNHNTVAEFNQPIRTQQRSHES